MYSQNKRNGEEIDNIRTCAKRASRSKQTGVCFEKSDLPPPFVFPRKIRLRCEIRATR